MSRRRASDQTAAAGDGPLPARLAHGLQRWFGGRTLPAQWAGLVLLASALVALLLAALAQASAALISLHTLGPQLWAVGLTGLACALAGSWLAQRSSQALRDISTSSRLLRRDDAPADANLPLHTGSAEWQLASLALRRLVDQTRAQRLALQLRNAQLGEQLHQRSHELSTLQDLSHGLAASSDLFGLVDEALKALEQTLDYSSASVWARDRRGETSGGSPADTSDKPDRPDKPDKRQVVLTGYRSSDTLSAETADKTAQPLLGKRLSKANLQRYEQIERERGPLIDNDARQGLLSWLWEKVTDDASTSALYRGTRSWIGLPLQFRDEVLAVMRVDHQSPGYFNPERVRLLGAVCSQTALALHHAQLLLHERTLAVAAERNRIARDLHDAVSQTLFASNVIAGTLARGVLRSPPVDAQRLAAQATQLERLNRGALAEMRMLLYELQPEALDNQPLAALLHHPIEALACRGDLQIDTSLAALDTLPPAARVQLYRIAQEALSNVARHSGAAQVSVLWQPDAAGGAWLRISDDGQGFETTLARPGHFGLANMHSRAQEVGATLLVRSAPGQGTDISVYCAAPGATAGAPSGTPGPGPAPATTGPSPAATP